ncbi:MFS transporter [Haloferula rosea]|uniref:MFS transporter n=1 Tax=Haloferula rosea TaxID=490093 RepID=A0A934VHC2_9BACT|nr:MFS transporter [Haloferula rosea]MBK1828916.1 MFS transporter [Haloferula rosea]
MIVQQTQNAFNDKAAQFILVPLGGAIAFSVESWATIMIALPFVLFAPLAGWLSDRFSKRDVMLGAAIAQLLILLWLCASIHIRSMELALCGFFALAVQSAFFSPAKIGINKELVGSKHLGFAAGIQQMMAMLAILSGQIAAGIIYDQRYKALGETPEVAWQAAFPPLVVLAALAVPAIFMAWVVPRTPAQGAEKLHGGILIQHFKHLGDLWRDAPLRQASFGVAFFWGFATFINLWSVKLAKVLTEGQGGFGTLSSWFMAAATLGMALGFGVASFLLRKRIELGWVPLAGVAMTVTALIFALQDPTGSLRLLSAAEISFHAVLKAALSPISGSFLWGLASLAFFAALFLAPLNAWMQDRYPPNQRGELQSAVNLQDCLIGIIAAAFVEGLVLIADMTGVETVLGYRIQLAIAGVGCGLITWFIIRLLPGHFVRVIGLSILRIFYRIRPVGAEHIPEKGGVLLLPSHVSWADAFFITAASPRPVRFVMDAIYMEKPAIRWFCTLFETVPIDLGKPREAMRTAAAALQKGDLVCLFPEGRLTRTGTLLPLKRGFEIIARQAKAPIVPAWLDGAWGSIFSFEGNRYFRKRPHRIPYGLAISFGEPIEPRDASISLIRHGILKASSAAVEARLKGWKRPEPRAVQANGYQLGQINALPRRQAIARLSDDPEIDALPSVATFTKLFKVKLHHRDQASPQDHCWVGGSKLRHSILALPPTQGAVPFYDFSPDALDPIDPPGWIHCPCLAVDGIIVAMSFPDPPKISPSCSHQPGSKPGTYGHLLPGFDFSEKDGITTLHGPAAGPDGLQLPHPLFVDDLGFVGPRQDPETESPGDSA